jgi:thioester reductase-like protein
MMGQSSRQVHDRPLLQKARAISLPLRLTTMGACVILTGSTGNLGTYLLASLANSGTYSTIYCLNRSEVAEQRQATLLTERGLTIETSSTSIVFHQAKFDAPLLGLDEDNYQILVETTKDIIHCAWPVDFNRTFQSFLPSIQGVINFIDLAHKGSNKPSLYFISSISAAGNWNAVPGARHKVPEEEIDDWKVARLGYGRSKLVSERLIAEAVRTKKISAAICRVGQVCGPVDHGVKGAWPLQEWLPSLIVSSITMGKLPETLGPMDDVDWIPVDRLADVLTEIMSCELHPGSIRYLHLINPNPVRWNTLMAAVVSRLERLSKEARSDGSVVVSFREWVDTLEKTSREQTTDVRNIPAIKLQGFFHDLQQKAIHVPRARAALLDVKKTVKLSKSLATMPAVNVSWMDLWIRQWNI